MSPEEEGDLRGIERAIGKRLPRVTLPDFDYKARPEARLEVPLAQRIAEIRARKAEERRAREGQRGAPRRRRGAEACGASRASASSRRTGARRRPAAASSVGTPQSLISWIGPHI